MEDKAEELFDIDFVSNSTGYSTCTVFLLFVLSFDQKSINQIRFV